MNFHTQEHLQELANKKGKPICAWVPCFIKAGQLQIVPKYPHIWIIDPSGRIKDFKNPNVSEKYNIKETDRWASSLSLKMLVRPKKGNK